MLRAEGRDGDQPVRPKPSPAVGRHRPCLSAGRGSGTVNKLFARGHDTQIKVEVTPVLRSCVFEPKERAVSSAVEEQFGFAAMQVVSFADLFAGKVAAALDRQHPRDLFDIHDLLSNEGIDDELRAAFIVYLVSHHRPIERLLAPARRDMREEFERGLQGMMEVPVALDVLERTREELVAEIVGRMPMPTGRSCRPSQSGNRIGPCSRCAMSAAFPQWSGG